MGVASGCGYQEAGVVIQRWVLSECSCLVGGVVRRYIDFLILLIPTPLVYISSVFAAAFLLVCSFFNNFLFLFMLVLCNIANVGLLKEHSRSFKN